METDERLENLLDDIIDAQVQMKPCFTWYGLAKKLAEKGYCKNAEQVLVEFAAALKQEFFFMKNSASKDALYQFTDSQLDNFLKKFCSNRKA